MSINYTALKADIATHAELNNLDDVASADWYNQQVENGPVPWAELKRTAMQEQITIALRKAANDVSVTGDLRAVVEEALSLFVDGGLDPVDVGHSTFTALVGTLKTASIINDAQETAINALAANRQTRGEKAGFGRLTPSDIAKGRAA